MAQDARDELTCTRERGEVIEDRGMCGGELILIYQGFQSSSPGRAPLSKQAENRKFSRTYTSNQVEPRIRDYDMDNDTFRECFPANTLERAAAARAGF